MRDQVVIDDVLARRFLLGELAPEEQGRIQELAFEDPEAFEFLESVENDLIDEFIHGDLSEEEAARFEDHFLTHPGRRNNLFISQLWQEHVRKQLPRRKWKSPFQWFSRQPVWVKLSIGLATLVLLGFVVLVIAAFRSSKHPTPIQAGPDNPGASPSPELKISPSQQPTSSPSHAENKPKSLTPQKQKKLFAATLLLPSSSPRSEGVHQVELPRDSQNLPLELAFITDRKFKSLEASLQDATEVALKRWPNLQVERGTSGKALKIDVPVSLLTPGKVYWIVVSGVSMKNATDNIARYPFQVAN